LNQKQGNFIPKVSPRMVTAIKELYPSSFLKRDPKNKTLPIGQLSSKIMSVISPKSLVSIAAGKTKTICLIID